MLHNCSIDRIIITSTKDTAYKQTKTTLLFISKDGQHMLLRSIHNKKQRNNPLPACLPFGQTPFHNMNTRIVCLQCEFFRVDSFHLSLKIFCHKFCKANQQNLREFSHELVNSVFALVCGRFHIPHSERKI